MKPGSVRLLTVLLSSLPARLRAQIVREHHALLEDRIAWSVLSAHGTGAAIPVV